MKAVEDLLKKAYKKLKASTYYDKTTAMLRGEISLYEEGGNKVFEDLAKSISTEEGWQNLEKELLESVDYIAYPKSINRTNTKKSDETGIIISNHPGEKLEIKDYNLFLSADTKLHILGALWVMEIGSILDSELYENSFGNRLRPEIFDEIFNKVSDEEIDKKSDEVFFGGNYSPHLFRYYFREYERWWSKAIDITKNMTESDKGALIMSLDLSSFYYNVSFTKEEFDSFYDKYRKVRDIDSFYDEYKKMGELHEHYDKYREIKKIYFIIERLNKLVYAILCKYGEKTKDKLDKCNNDCYLPINFLPSNILANYSLKDFDSAILDKMSPAYYGRYVDDILIVVNVNKASCISNALIGGKYTALDIIG